MFRALLRAQQRTPFLTLRAGPAPTLVRALSSSSDAAAAAAAAASLAAYPPLSVFSEEEEAIRQSARAFANTTMRPRVLAQDKAHKMDSEVIAGLHEGGFLAVETDPAHGGAGASFVASCLVIEELARVDASVAILVDINLTLIAAILRQYATKKLQDYALPLLARSAVGSFALSEPGSGSDAFSLKTTALRSADGASYVLNGSKCWISNGGEASFFLVFANVDPSLGYKGITCFLVDRDTPGFTVGRKEDKLGLRASSTVTLSFDNVKVPADRVVGEVGKGYKIAIESLNEGRIGIAAQMLGIAQGAMDAAMPYLFQRKQFGQRLADFQGMQHQYAQAATEIEAVRCLTYNAARLKMAGMPFVREAAMAKLYSSQVAERTASKAVEWLGGMGFVTESGVEKFYRDVKIGAIYEGTSNIQLTTIAKLMASDYGAEAGRGK